MLVPKLPKLNRHRNKSGLQYSTVSVIFPLASLLSSLYWPWDPLSSLESTPVSISVPKQVDCDMCRFSKLLLFSFFFCKDGSDRLMKRASYSCCNFLCVVLAAAYLKYRRCRLSCLPFVWHFFSLWHTHTHTEVHTYGDVYTYGDVHTCTHPSVTTIPSKRKPQRNVHPNK